jgi:putative flippase GtrA
MNLRTIARFLLVGLSGTLVDFSLFAFSHQALGMSALVANTMSYSAGILNNFWLHRTWTFAHRPQRGSGVQFSQFVGVSLTALLINNLIVLLLTPVLSGLLGEGAVGLYLAKVCATGAGVIWNFLANHLWTFRAAPANTPQIQPTRSKPEPVQAL